MNTAFLQESETLAPRHIKISLSTNASLPSQSNERTEMVSYRKAVSKQGSEDAYEAPPRTAMVTYNRALSQEGSEGPHEAPPPCHIKAPLSINTALPSQLNKDMAMVLRSGAAGRQWSEDAHELKSGAAVPKIVRPAQNCWSLWPDEAPDDKPSSSGLRGNSLPHIAALRIAKHHAGSLTCCASLLQACCPNPASRQLGSVPPWKA